MRGATFRHKEENRHGKYFNPRTPCGVRPSVLCLAGDGMQEVIEKPPDEREKLRAAEMLGKRYGLYTEKIEQQTDMELKISVDYGDEE